MQIFKPFASILIVLVSLATVAQLRIYERQLGYEVWSLHREQRLASEEKKRLNIVLAKLSRPQHVEGVAQRKFDLKKLSQKQIIRLNPLAEKTQPMRFGGKLN